jgi:tRNA/rRNA methyltransferase
MAGRIVEMSQQNEIALVFGPEDTGLSNEDIRLCHMLVTIPTAEFKSLNLSHAVMIICYEIFVARTLPSDRPHEPRLATSGETEAMYEQVKCLLTKIGFLNPQNPDYWMLHIRRFLSRTSLLAREVKIIRGICRQLDWYMENGKRKKT